VNISNYILCRKSIWGLWLEISSHGTYRQLIADHVAPMPVPILKAIQGKLHFSMQSFQFLSMVQFYQAEGHDLEAEAPYSLPSHLPLISRKNC